MNLEDHPAYTAAAELGTPLCLLDTFLVSAANDDTYPFYLFSSVRDVGGSTYYVGGTNPVDPDFAISVRLQDSLQAGLVTSEIVTAFQALARLHS